MIPFSLREVAGIAMGSFHGNAALLDQPVNDIVIDSRKAGNGALYVPIIGEVHDGHSFIDAAFATGALCTLTDRPLQREPYILVNSTLESLQLLAKAYRERFTMPIIGVTGSVGKTSTKDMLYAALSQCKNVFKTPGNLNNQTGVPQAIFQLENAHEAAILEMGTNHPGEIRRLAAMVQPTVCLFTNIGVAHIEFFGSRENIFRGKTEMLEHMRPNGIVVANGDDDMLTRIPGAITYGFSEGCHVRGTEFEDLGLDGTTMTAVINGEGYPLHIQAPGRHMAINALAAIAVGLQLNIPMTDLKAGVESFVPAAGRMQVLHTESLTIINDSYNANPNSMMAAIDTLSTAKGRKVCVLGDMLELGDKSPEFHQVVGMYAATHGIDLILSVGPQSEQIYCGVLSVAPERGIHYATQEELLTALPELLKNGDTLLVKASRGMHLEKTVEAAKAIVL